MSNDWNINLTGIPRGSPVNIYLQCSGQGPTLDEIAALINQRSDEIMATMQQVLADLDDIKTQSGTYIAGRDAIDVDLRATIADLIAKLAAAVANDAADAATIKQFQSDTDAAFAKAEEDKGLLTIPTPPSPPAP